MTHDEMIAVITAHKEGKAIEWRSSCSSKWLVLGCNPTWNFGQYEYRIKPTPIQQGDLTWEAAKRLHEEGVKVQWLTVGGCGWILASDSVFAVTAVDSWKTDTAYRRAPVPRKVPLGPEDVPPWSVVKPNGSSWWQQVLSVNQNDIHTFHNSISYDHLMNHNWVIQRPGQDWQRCEKDEVVG